MMTIPEVSQVLSRNTCSISWSLDDQSRIPFGPAHLIIGGKKISQWDDGFPVYLDPVVHILNYILKLSQEAVIPDTQATTIEQLISKTGPHHKLPTDEFLDGATFYVLGSSDEICIVWKKWPDWGSNGGRDSPWESAICDRSDLEWVVARFEAIIMAEVRKVYGDDGPSV